MSSYDDRLPEEMKKHEEEYNSHFGWPMFFLSLPVFLFCIPWYLAWSKAVEYMPSYTIGDKMFFYGLCVGLFQAFYTLITMGYGLVAVPASILSFLILVFLL